MNAPTFALLMGVLATGAAAQNDTQTDIAISPPVTSLVPQPRPEGVGKELTAAQTPTADQTDEADEDASGGQTVEMADKNASDGKGFEADAGLDESAPSATKQAPADPQALAACHRELRASGAIFDTLEAIADPDDAGCGITNPIGLSGLPGGVELKPAGQMRCETALALVRWSEDQVRPAAEHLPGRGALAAIEQGSTYICRRRNNLPQGKISEHAFGNAVDIMAFHFETGEPIKVQPRERDGTMAEAFQDAVRATACLHFKTVLGPGTDATHADHLHLDVKPRNGGFRLCQ